LEIAADLETGRPLSVSSRINKLVKKQAGRVRETDLESLAAVAGNPVDERATPRLSTKNGAPEASAWATASYLEMDLAE
jgi:hypothetical protein